MRYTTHSAQETREIGARIAGRIARTKPRSRAALFALNGELGSGKTTFVGGVARGLGIRRRTVSPTFTIMRRYAIPKRTPAYRRGYRSLVHVDAYRVHKPKELAIVRFDEWIADPSSIVLIEWAGLIRGKKLGRPHRITFRHRDGNIRDISVAY
jgi:tRNA threonylcarbamoyl adenosine modification protein YjeE